MRDIVDRLRHEAGLRSYYGDPILWEAAEEIERLRHDITKAMANHNADLNNECICPKCGIRHGGSSANADF